MAAAPAAAQPGGAAAKRRMSARERGEMTRLAPDALLAEIVVSGTLAEIGGPLPRR